MFFFIFFLRVGIDLPTIEVRFEHLNVDAEAYVGSRALPTIFNFSINILEVTVDQNSIIDFGIKKFVLI